jgi:hypothetical protein
MISASSGLRRLRGADSSAPARGKAVAISKSEAAARKRAALELENTIKRLCRIVEESGGVKSPTEPYGQNWPWPARLKRYVLPP